MKKHRPEVVQRATDLFFKIEKHFYFGGGALTVRDVGRMLGMTSTASQRFYVGILLDWKLIKHIPHVYRTILLAETNYPPVEYREF